METTASIIAVVQLCEKVIKYISAVAGAKQEKFRLRSQILTCFGLLMKLKDEAEDPTQAQGWLKTLELLSDPLRRLREALSLASTALSVRDGLQERLRWPFREKEVDDLISAVEHEMSMVSFAMKTDSTRLLIAIDTNSKRNEQHLMELKDAVELCITQSSSASQELETVQTVQDHVLGRVEELHERKDMEEAREKRQRVLDWLTPVNHDSEQREAIRRRQPGTGGWLLDSEIYQDWLETNGLTLFCPGIPGAGKTVFASIINADLWDRYHNDSAVGLAYLFCNYRRQDEQTAEALLSGLLKQLSERQATLPECVKNLYDSQQEGAPDRTEATTDALQSVMANYSRVFIVIDALDECSTSNGCRMGILSTIQSLQALGHINVLATSRFIPEITERFRTASQVEIQADSSDVRAYLSGNMTRLPKAVQKNAELREEIISKIVEIVGGM